MEMTSLAFSERKMFYFRAFWNYLTFGVLAGVFTGVRGTVLLGVFTGVFIGVLIGVFFGVLTGVRSDTYGCYEIIVLENVIRTVCYGIIAIGYDDK